jgi:uncharacterized protein
MKDSIITIGENRFHVEVAETPAQRRHGLMYQKQMNLDGMLFIMGTAEPVRFHMKNTLIPLDIVFADAGGKILKIAQMHPHVGKSRCTNDVSFVLELPMGACDNLQIKRNDVINLSNIKSAANVLENFVREIIVCN